MVSRQPGPGRITWSELSESGLPLCDVVINLAGENILNPLRRWNETFQKEVLTSRLDTTHLLAKAITETAHPPQAWILVTGVGTLPNHQPLTLTEPGRTEQAVEALGACTRITGPSQGHCLGLQPCRFFLTQICTVTVWSLWVWKGRMGVWGTWLESLYWEPSEKEVWYGS